MARMSEWNGDEVEVKRVEHALRHLSQEPTALLRHTLWRECVKRYVEAPVKERSAHSNPKAPILRLFRTGPSTSIR